MPEVVEAVQVEGVNEVVRFCICKGSQGALAF